jgi:hypothetical protein
MSEVSQKVIAFHESKHPQTQTLLDYWNSKRASRSAPSWSDIDLLDLPSSLIPHLVVVDVIADPLNFKYRFWGGWHVQYHGYDQTNKFMSDIEPLAYRSQITNQCVQMLNEPTPILFLQRIPRKSGLWVYSELCRFPLSDDGETVTKILTAEFAIDDIREAPNYFHGTQD